MRDKRRELAAMFTIDPENDIDKSDQKDSWEDFYQKEKGKVLGNYRNALLVLENDPNVSGVHFYNEMNHSPVLKEGRNYHNIDDPYFRHIWEYLQNHTPMRRVEYGIVKQAVLRRCELHPFHPVRDYLNNLKWDGVFRLDQWLTRYLGAENKPYHQKVGRWFLISMIARIFEPGCQCDYMMILEGPQRIGKSSAWRILFGEYFSEYFPSDLNSRDACNHVTSFWGICHDEMDVLGKRSSAELKSFITRTHEKFRPVWETMIRTFPRQCVFVGTINHETYLIDETGGTRYWGVKCGKINLDALRHDRDQLLAEAVQRYRDKWAYHPDAEFQEHFIKPEQIKRQSFDEWQNVILTNWAAIRDHRKTTIAEIYQIILGLGGDQRCSLPDQHRISKILQKLEARQFRDKYGRYWDLSSVKR
jgi:predicted P-loop ATPase